VEIVIDEGIKNAFKPSKRANVSNGFPYRNLLPRMRS